MPVDIRADNPINPDEGIPKPQLDVTARPVDTYVRPVSASATALGQLAGALKGLNPALEGVENKFKAAEEAQGQTMSEVAFAKEKGNWEAAVKNGEIPSVLNPFARMRAREVFGRLAGDKLAGDISADPQYIQENQNATTIQQHDTAWANARSRWESKNLGRDSHNDPIFQNTFQQMAAAHTQDARNRAVAEVEKNFVSLNGEHLHDEIMAHIVQGQLDGVEHSQLQAELEQMAAASGLPETVVRASLASAIDDYAHKMGDVSAYDLAEGLKIKGYDGKMYTMDTDRDLDKLRSAGTAYILRENYQAVRLENAQKISKREAVENTVVTELAAEIAANPTGKIDLEKYQNMYTDAGMGSRISDLPRFIKAIQDKTVVDDQAIKSYTVRIRDPEVHPGSLNYVTTGTLTHALASGQLSMSGYKTLQAMVDRRDKKFSGSSQYTADPDTNLRAHERGISMIKDLFSPARITQLGIKGDPYYAGVLAQQEYHEAFDKYMAQHKGAVDTEALEKFLDRVIQTINTFYFEKGPTGTQLKSENQTKKPDIPVGDND